LWLRVVAFPEFGVLFWFVRVDSLRLSAQKIGELIDTDRKVFIGQEKKREGTQIGQRSPGPRARDTRRSCA
jgi:hypothetical protein